MRKVVCHVQFFSQHGSPPPACKSSSSPWEDLPQTNRQRLLWLLSQLLQRQLEPRSVTEKEDGDERDESAK